MSGATSVSAGRAGLSFEITDEQRALRDLVINFAKRELAVPADEDSGEAFFSRETWRKCAELGIQGLLVPSDYGGAGADVVTFIVAMEALGYACRDNGLL